MRFDQSNTCRITVDSEGKHKIVTPEGKEIPRIVWTRVYDGLVHEGSYVIAKIFVNLDLPNDQNKTE